jgi:hypothetical protein
MREKLIRAARSALAATAAVLGLVTTSHAAVYVGTWDPPYGNAFPNLGWRGEIRIDAPTNCGASPTFTGLAPCAPGAAFVTSAFVELYLLDTGPTFPTYNTLTFTPSSMNIVSLGFDSSGLTGAVSSRSNWIYDATMDAEFALQFAFNGMAVAPSLPNVLGADTYSGPVLWYKDMVCIREHRRRHDYDHDDECEKYKTITGTNDLASAATRPDITFSQVPEPGSLALVLAGMMGVVGVRRGARGRA